MQATEATRFGRAAEKKISRYHKKAGVMPAFL